MAKPCPCGRVCDPLLFHNGYCLEPAWRMVMTAKMQQTTTAEEIVEVTIDTEAAARMAATLATYQELKVQRDLLDEAMAVESKKILGEMDLLGVNSVRIEGTPCTVVRGYTSSLDKMKFVSLGGSLAMLESATVSKPRKPYLRIGAAKEEKAA